MTVTVSPETFEFVNYEHDPILAIAEQAAADAGIPEGARIHLEIVESSPLGRVHIDSMNPGPPPEASFRIEGGAFENLKAPRQFDAVRTGETLGRMFFRLADAVDPAFGFDAEFDGLPVPRMVAWDVYAVGRLVRKGYQIGHDRWLYLWRNRHGFSDAADGVFERLWNGDGLTWADIQAACDETAEARESATA